MPLLSCTDRTGYQYTSWPLRWFSANLLIDGVDADAVTNRQSGMNFGVLNSFLVPRDSVFHKGQGKSFSTPKNSGQIVYIFHSNSTKMTHIWENFLFWRPYWK